MNKTKFFQKKTTFWLYKLITYSAVLWLFSSIVSCNRPPRTIEKAFYHWKTHFEPSDFEKNYCQKLSVQKIYLRLFDIDWDDKARFPLPIAVSDSVLKTPFNIVPTIFITNKTFIQLPDYQIDTLAHLVLKKIASCTEGVNFNEIQIDCDWTERTQKRFFSFLKVLKQISNKKISATIRLHQVKFKDKTGIPPVDEGVLMVYNMGNLDDEKTQNSILDIPILKSYINSLNNYPLKLNIALPLFSWGVVLRDGEVVKLMHNFDKNELLNTPHHDAIFKVKNDNQFEILKNTYVNGYYLYKDDEIRIENIPLSTLEQAADVISQNLDNQNLTVIFYHLDSVSLQRYRYEDLDNIIHRFQ